MPGNTYNLTKRSELKELVSKKETSNNKIYCYMVWPL